MYNELKYVITVANYNFVHEYADSPFCSSPFVFNTEW